MPKPWMVNNPAIEYNQKRGADRAKDSPKQDMGVAGSEGPVDYASFGETKIHINPDIVGKGPSITETINDEVSGTKQRKEDDAPRTVAPRGKPRWGNILKPGPIDPLTQAPIQQRDYSGMFGRCADLLEHICKSLDSSLVIQRMRIPTLRCNVNTDGGTTLVASVPTRIWFEIEKRRVPSLQLIIFNNTGNTIYFDVDEPASLGSIPLTTGTGYETVTTVDTLSVFAPSGGTINTQAGTGIYVRAWSNPEWRNMWGQ